MTERRRQPRLRALGLATPFGEVIDISDTGLGVFRKGKLTVCVGDTVTLTLSHASKDLEITTRVARIDNVGLFRHEIGLEFVNINEDTLTDLWTLTDSACSEFTGPRCWVAA